MPEGPETHLAAKALDRALRGETATSLYFAFPHLKRFQRRLAGRQITGVTARGKATIIGFDNGWCTYSHNQLYGRWYVCAAGRFPTTKRQLRLAVHCAQHSALLYSASDIEVLQQEQLVDHPYLSRLGPDPLAREVNPARLRQWLQRPEFRRRRLGSLLLDPHFVAGIGNYLRSEVLFAARLDPGRRLMELDDHQIVVLAGALCAVCRRSFRTRGITNDRARVAALRRAGQTRRQYRFKVFARAGQPCYECGSTIRQLTVAGRRCYLCPACQQD